MARMKDNQIGALNLTRYRLQLGNQMVNGFLTPGIMTIEDKKGGEWVKYSEVADMFGIETATKRMGATETR